nr:EOG090X032R [Triops cancriformis]
MFRSRSMTIAPQAVDSKESRFSRLFRKAPKRVRDVSIEEIREQKSTKATEPRQPAPAEQESQGNLKKTRSRSSTRLFQSKESPSYKENVKPDSKAQHKETKRRDSFKLFRSNFELSSRSEVDSQKSANNELGTAKAQDGGLTRNTKHRGSLRKLSTRKAKNADKDLPVEETDRSADVIVRERSISSEIPTSAQRATFALFASKTSNNAEKKAAKSSKKAKSSTDLAVPLRKTDLEELPVQTEIVIVGQEQPVVEKRRFSFGSFKRSNTTATATLVAPKSIAPSPASESVTNNELKDNLSETAPIESVSLMKKETRRPNFSVLMRSKSKERLKPQAPDSLASIQASEKGNEQNKSQGDDAIVASVTVPKRAPSWFRSKESVNNKSQNVLKVESSLESAAEVPESSETVNPTKKRSSFRLFRSNLPRLSKSKAGKSKRSQASSEAPEAVTNNESDADVNETSLNSSLSEAEETPKKKRLSFAADPSDTDAENGTHVDAITPSSKNDAKDVVVNEPESKPAANVLLEPKGIIDAPLNQTDLGWAQSGPAKDDVIELKTIGARLATEDSLPNYFTKTSTANTDAEKEENVFNPALLHVRDNLSGLDGRLGAENTDLLFLKSLMDSPIMRSLVKVQDQLEESVPASKPVASGNCELTLDLITTLKSKFANRDAQELAKLLQDPHIKALLQSHDLIADKSYEQTPSPSDESDSEPSSLTQTSVNGYHVDMPADISDIRIVSIRKTPGEPLGLTVKVEDGQLVVARILGGGMIDRQGLLHVGDVIGEVNGVHAKTPEELQVEIARAKEHITLKILPSFQEIAAGAQCYMRALFDYDPKDDKLLPCPEIGLTFKQGDILQIVNQSDPNWWQAKKVGWSGPAGLIPSQELEERRKAFVAPEADYVHKVGFCGTRVSRKKKKVLYQIKSSAELDKAELLLYEEVTRMPPFRRKTLILIGSEGIGRRTLKNRLINSDAERFGTVLPHTSRPMRELEDDGMGYWFVSREDMEIDIRSHQYLEYGEHNGHLYGTKLDSIRNVIRHGKMCILDCSPNSLKTLHNSPEFMPFVIFLAAPGMDQLKYLYDNNRYSSRNLTLSRGSSMRVSSRRARTLESLASLYEEEDFKSAVEESARLQRTYEKYFDMVIVNEEPDTTFRKVVEALEALSNQHQWVPVSWVY